MTIRLNGSTSGYTEIDAPAVAGAGVLTLPTGTGTIAKETGAWTAWTPTVSGYTGTVGTVTINSCAYTQIGKTVICRLDYFFVPGAAATALYVTLPVPALMSRSGSVSLYETLVSGWVIGGWFVDTSRVIITNYAGAAPWSGTATNRHTGTFTYEAA